MAKITNLELIKYYNINPTKILDVGAHLGEFAMQCKKLWPDAYVHMIEANKNCSYALSQFDKFGYNHTITLLGNENKEVTYYTQADNDWGAGNSIYRELTQVPYTETKLFMTTIDDLFDNSVYFDLIKIDVQGAELDVMKGGRDFIDNAQCVILELSIQPYNDSAPLYKEVIDYMLDINYVPSLELERHYLNKQLIQIDIAFFNLKYIENE
jgi:hypothetical protein